MCQHNYEIISTDTSLYLLLQTALAYTSLGAILSAVALPVFLVGYFNASFLFACIFPVLLEYFFFRLYSLLRFLKSQLQMMDVIDNLWLIATERANEAGKEMAKVIDLQQDFIRIKVKLM